MEHCARFTERMQQGIERCTVASHFGSKSILTEHTPHITVHAQTYTRRLVPQGNTGVLMLKAYEREQGGLWSWAGGRFLLFSLSCLPFTVFLDILDKSVLQCS